MSSTVMKQELSERQKIKKAVQKYDMPQPSKGQCIIFYPKGAVTPANAEIAFVTKLGEKAIGVSHRGQGWDTVFHVDDPRLELNPDLRRDIHGVWEFNEADIEVNERLDHLETVVAALTAEIGSLKKPAAKKRTAAPKPE